MADSSTITGRRRERRTRWTVKLIDRLAKRLIVIGGIGTIAAVLSVCVFLIWVAWPLIFFGGSGRAQVAGASRGRGCACPYRIG